MSTPDPNIRISNAEREAIIGRLQSATEEGRLELDEFAERSQKVYEAKTYAEVERLLTDLPDEAGALSVPGVPRPSARVPDLELAPSFSSVKREGGWTVPAKIVAKPKYGSVKLDCRHAEFSSREVSLEVGLAFSSVEVVLPRGASALDDGVDLHGGSMHNGCHDSGGPRLKVTGNNWFGSVKIRYERRFLWWRW